MRYTWPKFKLCRREWINLFWVPKYDIKKRRKTPGQHGGSMSRLSEYWKLLRNKQVLRRMYLLSEKKFHKLVTVEALKYSKNKWISHDVAVFQFLERRLDSMVLKAWFASTIMQARQMVNHSHFLLNGKKHNISSYLFKKWDVLEVKEKSKTSPLFSEIPINSWNFTPASWLSVDKEKMKIQVLDYPKVEEQDLPVDILKVIEFYARW